MITAEDALSTSGAQFRGNIMTSVKRRNTTSTIEGSNDACGRFN